MMQFWLMIPLILFLAILLVFIVLNILRKWFWDAIHSNLLDLVDQIGGQVMRRGFFSRPVYHGRYAATDVTINFSTEKRKKGRANLIDISLTTGLNESVTISAYSWLKELEEKSLGEYLPLGGKFAPDYGIRLAASSRLKVKTEAGAFSDSLDLLHPFRFVFISPRGMLFEKEAEHLPQATRHPRLLEQLDGLMKLIKDLQE